MKIEKPIRRRRPKSYSAKPEFERKHPKPDGKAGDGAPGKPLWSRDDYRKMDRACLRALSCHHVNMVARARALNRIMDQRHWAK